MQVPHAFPALLGDSQGRYRVHIMGNSGTGKSTTAATLAAILRVPCLSLDAVMFKPGWITTPHDEFETTLRSFDEHHRETGWVVDGDYMGQGRALVLHEAATDIIWLDPPLLLYLPRLVIRTFLRLFRLNPPCAPGCNERFGEVFFSAKDSIIWWCISNHSKNRRENQYRMQRIGLGIGSEVEGQKMRRIGGWGSELKRWLSEVRKMVDLKRAKHD